MEKYLTEGAMSVFVGKVRADIESGKKVIAIEYSTYPEMATKAGDEITEKIKNLYTDVKSIRIVHSTGIVKAGEASLFIMVTAGHREEATSACKEALEMVKELFPVWKKEHFDDSSSGWKQN
jgi:molybdopterin synthase catalytic subunit